MPNKPPSSDERIRARNERRCRRLLQKSEILATDDLDWDSVGQHALHPATIATLIYMRDVESFTPSYLDGLGSHPATLNDPIAGAFLDVWENEEQAHADALDHYLDRYAAVRGVDIPATQASPPAMGRLAAGSLRTITRPVGHVVTAMHMAWGAVNELLTMNGYRMLAARDEDPVLTELLSRIAAQEARHYGFYFLQAEWRLAESRLARSLVPRLLERAWTPVGVGEGYKDERDFDVVFAHLASGDGADRLAGMNATIARLPGCDDLALYRPAVVDTADTPTRRLPAALAFPTIESGGRSPLAA